MYPYIILSSLNEKKNGFTYYFQYCSYNKFSDHDFNFKVIIIIVYTLYFLKIFLNILKL